MITIIAAALQDPKWPLFLGRKSCPPAVPVGWKWDSCRKADMGEFDSLRSALESQAWFPRYEQYAPCDKTKKLDCLIEWRAPEEKSTAPVDAEVWYDKPISFDPPMHEPRLVERMPMEVKVGEAHQQRTPHPQRPRANYKDGNYKELSKNRLASDHGLCVFCKAPATTMHHITYRHAGGGEQKEELRSLCRLCHDAVTMIEYGLGMGLDRIDPCEPRWRNAIIEKRDDIVKFRSLEVRQRRFSREDVE